MAQPTPYERQFAFSGQPRATWAEGLENELNAVKVTSDETLANLELIQRDDGKLRNGIVTRDSLSPDLAPTGFVALVFADEATAVAGEADNVAIAPLGVKQQIDARLADETTPDTNDEKLSTPEDVVRRVVANAKDGAFTPDGGSLMTIGEALEQALAEAAGTITKATWSELAGIIGDRNGQRGLVPTSDAGTHTDPVVGGTKANSGTFSWSVSPAGWQRIDAYQDVASLKGGVSTKYDTLAEIVSAASMPREVLSSSANLNTIILPGLYFGVSAGTMTGLPAGLENGVAFFLFISVYDTGASGRFVPQKIARQSDLTRSFERVLDQQNPTSTTGSAIWREPKPGSNTIVASMLTDTYEYRGTVSSGSANAIVAHGQYILSGSITDLPAGVPSGGLLTVANFNASFIIQLWQDTTNPSKAYVRTIRPDTPPGVGTFNPWYATNTPGDNSVVATALTTAYRWRGTLNGVSANLALDDGIYTITGSVTDLPAGVPEGGKLRVVSFNASYIDQYWYHLDDATISYVRTIRPGVGTYGPWRAIGKPLSGSYVAFGDSITEWFNWPAKAAARLGLTATNVGFGGCRMANHSVAVYNPFSMVNLVDYIASGDYSGLVTAAQALYDATGDDNRAIVTRLAAINWAQVKYVSIFYGTNDFAGAVPIGTDTDMTGATFKGATNYVIETLLTAHPHLKPFLMAAPWRSRQSAGDGKDADLVPNTAGIYFREYVDALKARAEDYHLPALDLYRTSGINRINASIFLSDGLHPTATLGDDLIAEKVAGFIGANF